MRNEEVRDWYVCEGCGHDLSAFDVVCAQAPKLYHGTLCEECGGSGEIEYPIDERHPYGDSYAIEHLINIEVCTECNGRGYHLDNESCIVCGLPVTDGVLIQGWHVHDGLCATDHVPTIVEPS
ncbi:MAG: hypothetical protein GY906_28415 [bacterium]|nr:hypothetical protein [bacterium]